MVRRRLVAGNWKMNLSRTAAVSLARGIVDAYEMEWPEAVLCPSFVWLEAVGAVLAGSGVELGAQDCAAESSGAFTGQVSAAMVASLASHVIVGHSERRRDACETNELVSRKAQAALTAGLTPIVCVGESIDDRHAGLTNEHVRRQLRAVINRVEPQQLKNIVVAYEPIWAIGTGETATCAEAESVATELRDELPADAANRVRILYGGSVSGQNARGFVAEPNIDGLLVGGACLDAGKFVEILAVVAD